MFRRVNDMIRQEYFAFCQVHVWHNDCAYNIKLILLMTSHNNLYKLRKLTNTLDLKGRYSTIDTNRPSEAVKLPTLNSINRSVKYGDVSFTFTRQVGKLRKEPEDNSGLQQQLAHSSLMTVRKKYDTINRERENEENRVKELQIERNKFLIEKQQYESEINGGRQKCKSLEQCLLSLKHQCQQSDMERKVMLHMINRLKQDKIFYDQLKYNKNLDLDLMDKNKSMILKENQAMKEQNDRIRKVYSKMVQHVEGQQHQREEHLDSMHHIVDGKVTAYQSCILKKEQMKEVAETTLAEKDQKEKNWYKVYLCQRFVEKMLRDKMDREMNKFNSVEMAYKNIKTATGVSTTEALISKFLNKQTTYGNMLGKIAQQEKKIIQLKEQGDTLYKQFQKLKLEQENLSISKKDLSDLSQEEKQFNNVSERCQKDYLFEETVKIWLQRNIKKFKVFGIEATKLQSGGGKEQVMNWFKEYLNKLNEEAGLAEEKKQEEIVEDSNLKGVEGKNLRVIVWSTNPEQDLKVTEKEHHHKQLTYTQHHHHYHSATSDNNDQDYVNQVRLEMIQNNDKFMKELKKKYEEIKKQRIEAQPKRKDIVFETKPRQAQNETVV